MRIIFGLLFILMGRVAWSDPSGATDVATYLKCDLGLQGGLTKQDDRWIDGKVRIVEDPGKGFYAFCGDSAYYEALPSTSTEFQLNLSGCGISQKFVIYHEVPMAKIGNTGFVWARNFGDGRVLPVTPVKLADGKMQDAEAALKAEVIRRLRYVPDNANKAEYRKDRMDADFKTALDSCNDISDADIKKTWLPYIRKLVFPAISQTSEAVGTPAAN